MTAIEEPVQLVRYDAMVRAIDAAYAVDEVKDIRDKALALQVYAHQAQNHEAERQASRIRIRAERKAGQLLAQMNKAKGAREPGTNRGLTRSCETTASTLADLGVSRDQSSRWQKLAEVPDQDFEKALADLTAMPTTNGVLRATQEPKPNPVSNDALRLWDQLRDFEEMLEKNPAEVMETMTTPMKDDVHTRAPRVSAWLRQIGSVR
jgi:hypothetical protein